MFMGTDANEKVVYVNRDEGTIPTEAYGNIEQKLAKGYAWAGIIMDINNKVSVQATRKLLNSIKQTNSKIIPFIFQATTPETLEQDAKFVGVDARQWSWPKRGTQRRDLGSGLLLTGYNARDERKVVSCLISHMRIWQVINTLPCNGGLVLEHDAMFTKEFKVSNYLVKSKIAGATFEDGVAKYGGLEELNIDIIGLNDPRGATRRSQVYHQKILDTTVNKGLADERFDLVRAPYVDDDTLRPQGIAGGSAYFIMKSGINKAWKNMRMFGLWPNDAILCKQLGINCYQIFPYVTKVQGVQSTTQG